MKQRPAKGAPADSCWRPRAQTPCCSSTFGLSLLPCPLSSELPFLEKLRSLLRKHVTIPQPWNVKQTDIVFPNGITVISGLRLPGGDRLPLVPGDPSLLHGLTQESRGFGGTRTLGRGLGCSPGQSLWLLLIPEHVPTSGTSEMPPHRVFLRGHRHAQGSPQPRPAPRLGTPSASPGPVRCPRAVRPSHWRSPKARAPLPGVGRPSGFLSRLGSPSLKHKDSVHVPMASSSLRLPPSKGLAGNTEGVCPPGWGREHAPHFAPRVFQSHPAHLQPKMPQRRPRGSGERVLRGVQTTAPGHSPHLRIDTGQEDPAAPTLLTQEKTRLRISFPELGLRGACHLICSDPTSCPTQAPMFPACTHRPASPSAPASTVCSQVTQHPNGPGASTPASPDTHLQTTDNRDNGTAFLSKSILPTRPRLASAAARVAPPWALLVEAQSWLPGLSPGSLRTPALITSSLRMRNGLAGRGLCVNAQTSLLGSVLKKENKGSCSAFSDESKSQDEFFIFKHLSAKKKFQQPSFSVYCQQKGNRHFNLGGK